QEWADPVVPGHRGFHTREPSELEVQPRRKTNLMAAAPGRGAGAAVVDERRVRGVMAVGLDAMAAGADIVVRIAVVRRISHVKVPGQLLVELVPVSKRVHVR